jgi:hypothetical protein
MPTTPRHRLGIAHRAPLAIVMLAAGAGHRNAAPPPPLAIEVPRTAPYAGTTLVLRADQVHRLAPVQWSATPHELAWVSPEGTVTFLEPGDVAVRATDGWRSGTRGFVVRENPAVQVVMRDRVVTRADVGDTVRIVGYVYDATGTRVEDVPVTYGLVSRGDVPPAATVTADGRFVATAPGIFTVIAESGRVTGRTIVIVEGPEERAMRALLQMRALRTELAGATTATTATAAGVPPRHHDNADSADSRHQDVAAGNDSAAADSTRPHRALAAVRVATTGTSRITIDELDAAPYDGTTQTLAAHVWVGDDRAPDATAQPVWESSDPTRAYVTQAGRVVFLAPGWVTISATHGGLTATRRVNVRWVPAMRLALRPSTADVRVGQPVRFREDVWMPGTIPVVDAHVNYAIIAHGISGPVPATITENRVFTASQPGVYTIIAEVAGVADKFTLLVREPSVAVKE